MIGRPLSSREVSLTLIGIAVCAAALRFWRLGQVPLIPDESYYWLWSEQLALSYFDHPPGVALLVRLSTLVLGKSEAGIRWLNAALGLGSVLLAYAIGAHLFSRYAGLLAAGVLAFGAPYLVISRFVYTDALQLFLVLLNLYLMIPFLVQEERGPTVVPTWRFWAVGLSMAALLNTKYSAYLYAAAMGTAVMLGHPPLLRDWRTWGSVGIALCGLLPTLTWNAANQWASFRWQYAHLTTGTVHQTTPLSSLRHALLYLTAPVACLSVLGVAQVRSTRGRILLLPAILLTAPVLLSPADSPRNLSVGTALLLLLAAGLFHRWMLPHRRSVALAALFGLFAVVGLYGLGTVLGTLSPSPLPDSSAATTIRRDAIGWRDARVLDLDPETPVFALDYGIASQLRYYADIPVQTAWGQYRIWGVPEICAPGCEGADAVVLIALPYVDPAVVSQRLRSAFATVEGPEQIVLGNGHETRGLRIWKARGCAIDTATFLQWFDFMELIRAQQAGSDKQ